LPVPESGEVELERAPGETPLRWVLRGAQDAPLASGTANPKPGAALDVAVTPAPGRPAEATRLARAPGDGRRRVALVLLDCADWHIVQYLRARGELPVLSALLAQGTRAVLTSDPPLTAAALEALVWPERAGSPTALGLLHRFGTELAGLSSIGENPLAALAWLLPETQDLFSALGAGPLSAANLLFAHGGIRSGRHGIVTGPQGLERRAELASAARDLDAAERGRFPELAALPHERDAVHLRAIAAELDAVEAILREGGVDLLALRVEPLDLLTHAHFAESVRSGQDDGVGLLFSVYRYIDWRLAGVDAALDSDDVLVVMSDHGIRSAMEHSTRAFFVAVGAGIAAGRLPGAPDLRGVPRLLAELLGVETAWPEGPLADLARALPAPALARAGAAREAAAIR
jgi:hypothetical protein